MKKKRDIAETDKDKCSREVICKTPHGGVKMVAYFYDKDNNRCPEGKNVSRVQILEFDENDVCVFSIISAPKAEENRWRKFWSRILPNRHKKK